MTVFLAIVLSHGLQVTPVPSQLYAEIYPDLQNQQVVRHVAANDTLFESLTLEIVQQQAAEHSPLTDNLETEARVAALRQQISRIGLYPSVEFGASASYQSDVIHVPFSAPGMDPTTFSRDRYRVGLDIRQPILAGGASRVEGRLEETAGERNREEIRVRLHSLREQVNEVYFNLLLLQKQIETNQSHGERIRIELDRMRSLVENGVMLSGRLYAVEAELLKAEQQISTLESSEAASYRVLALLTGLELDHQPVLETPVPASPGRTAAPDYPDEAMQAGLSREEPFPHLRPEFDLIEEERQLLNHRMFLARAKAQPGLSLFATTAYGRPGLDTFNDDLQPYAIVGLRADWSLTGWLVSDREREVLRVSSRRLNTQETLTERSIRMEIIRLEEQISGLEVEIEKDRQIIGLREKVLEESKHQLENGVITVSDHLEEMARLNEARLLLDLHEVELLQAQTDIETKIGVEQ